MVASGALSNLGSPNNICCEAAPAPHTTNAGPARVQSVPTLMQKATKRHVLCRSDRPQFTSFLKNLALMLDAFGEVHELSKALQSKSTTLSKAYTLVTCYINFSAVQ